MLDHSAGWPDLEVPAWEVMSNPKIHNILVYILIIGILWIWGLLIIGILWILGLLIIGILLNPIIVWEV